MLGLYPAIDWRGHLRRFLRDLSIDLLQKAVREPLTSPYTGFRLARAPMAAADTIEWVVRRLPDIGRQTLRTLSAGERLIPHALRLLRRASVLAIIGALGLAVIKPDVSSESALGTVRAAHRRQPLAGGHHWCAHRLGAERRSSGGSRRDAGPRGSRGGYAFRLRPADSLVAAAVFRASIALSRWATRSARRS